MDGTDEPITERIIGRLPVSWWVAASVWAAIPFVRPLVATSVEGHAPDAWVSVVTERLVFQVVFAYLVILSLVASRQLYRRSKEIEGDLERLGATGRIVRGTGSRAGPLILTAVLAGASFAYEVAAFGPVVAVTDLPLLAIPLLPVMTFVWTYLVVLIAVRRLGGQPLRLDRFPLDRMLGLSSVGSLASTALWLLLLAVLPAIFLTGGDVVSVVTAIVVLLVGVAAFFLSMVRLHAQMSTQKDKLVSQARSLFVLAYGPVRKDPTEPVLKQQAEPINAAKTLLDVAESTRVWPIDEGVLAKAGAVVFGVITALLVRLVFVAIGMA